MITANDILVSMTVLPVGISFLSKRKPGLVFGNQSGCVAWLYLWEMTISFSIFLVITLSITRTISLVRPFKQQNIRHLIKAVVTYLVLILARITIIYNLETVKIKFKYSVPRCVMYLTAKPDLAEFLPMIVSVNIVYTAPTFVVALSSGMSAVLLTRRNRRVQQRELQQSRNRATVTILLFALLYGVCNIPLVVDYILLVLSCFVYSREWFDSLYKFDAQLYYRNTMWTLLLAANSAANPILYYWRMPCLRVYSLTRITRILAASRCGGIGVTAHNGHPAGGNCRNKVERNITAYLPLTGMLKPGTCENFLKLCLQELILPRKKNFSSDIEIISWTDRSKATKVKEPATAVRIDTDCGICRS